MRRTRASSMLSEVDISTQTAATYPVKDIGCAHVSKLTPRYCEANLEPENNKWKVKQSTYWKDMPALFSE
jgi:hypothetical protein